MKKFSFLFLALPFLFGCANLFDDQNISVQDGFGSICVGDSSRAINADDIKIAKIEVTGYDFDKTLTTTVNNVTDGSGIFTVKNVPAGKNRIVTVWAYDSLNQKLGTTLVRALCDVSSGKTTSISVTQDTTALANVFNSLLSENYNISSINNANIQTIKNAIDSSKNWSLIDTEQIANDFKNSSLKSSSSYILKAGSVTFTNNYSSVTIQVGDPVSSILNAFTSLSGTISNVAPGTWPVYITADGNTTRTFVTVKAGESSNLGELGKAAVTDKIIVHVSGYTHIYAWVDADTKLFGDWPGIAMTDSDGDGWYDVTIEKTSSNLIFSNSGNNQTSDLSRTAGEWWYKDGKWYESNPDDSEKPVLLSFTSSASGTVFGNVDFTISASDNKSLSYAAIYLNSNLLTKVSLSGTNQSATYSWNTSTSKNATYVVSCTVFDAAGNSSSSSSLTLTTKNENLPPVAIISGPTVARIETVKEFSASSSYDQNGGTIASYNWSVTGATITAGNGTEKISVTMPSNETTVTVSLSVTDDEGATSETVTKSVSVKEKSTSSGDFREETIYFLMTARFYDGDSTNNRYCRADDKSGNRENNDPPWRGDFKGLIEKLDYIKALGFSAIWITPPVLNRSDFDFHGYHAWDMTQIDPRLESTGATYQDLIDAAHAKGIKIIQDIVLNHSSRFGLKNFFVPTYWGDRDNQYWGKNSSINYYDEYNPNFEYNGLNVEPNSGKSWYNGDLWSKEKPTLSWNPDLSNWGKQKNDPWTDGRPNYYFQWPSDSLALFDPDKYHTTWLKNWEDETCQTGTIHEDCIDLNTESSTTQKYLIDAYTKYIEMGVDAFRIDTVKHVSRNTFNRRFIPAFKEAGGDNFYMFGEVCTRVNEVWNHGVAPLSTPFYTWKERTTYSEDDTTAAHEAYEYENNQGTNNQPTSDNHALNGNNYHKPDTSMASGMAVIDFPMHWNFSEASAAYNQRGNDKYYNDATWNVVYVDSHDYGPNTNERYGGGTDKWAENMTYMWTFRGIPCLYYGSEIEFKAGCPTDKGSSAPLESTGRAYFGDHIEGSVSVSDYGEWSNATGEMATTLSKPLSKHLSHLNKIRREIPALQKGQYSNDGCNGNMAFKRRFTDDSTDSFVLVTISGDATFTGLPGGTYTDVITGDTKTISEGGSISASCSGTGNARVYVLSTSKTSAPGKISGNSPYLK